MMDDIFVYFLPLPGKVKECVTMNEDGSYSVFIKESLSPEDKLKAWNHARRHIQCLHFENRDVKNVQEVEREARQVISGDSAGREDAV